MSMGILAALVLAALAAFGVFDAIHARAGLCRRNVAVACIAVMAAHTLQVTVIQEIILDMAGILAAALCTVYAARSGGRFWRGLMLAIPVGAMLLAVRPLSPQLEPGLLPALMCATLCVALPRRLGTALVCAAFAPLFADAELALYELSQYGYTVVYLPSPQMLDAQLVAIALTLIVKAAIPSPKRIPDIA